MAGLSWLTRPCVILSACSPVSSTSAVAPALCHLIIVPLQGMLFLHGSSLGSHGNLKPSNCLVDGRMQVKLSGFGLWELKYGQTHRTYEKITDHTGSHWQIS